MTLFIIFLLFLFEFNESFKFNYYKRNFLRLYDNQNNNLPQKKPIILDINLDSFIENYDENFINNLQNYIFKTYKSEEEINDDSFDGYLKSEFYDIINFNLNYDDTYIYFEDFYNWRKNKIGTLWTYNELLEMYKTIVINKDGACNLFDFLLLNKIIDENDGADY